MAAPNLAHCHKADKPTWQFLAVLPDTFKEARNRRMSAGVMASIEVELSTNKENLRKVLL
jgi:hypothetical protein